jgi:hypothetical protein
MRHATAAATYSGIRRDGIQTRRVARHQMELVAALGRTADHGLRNA